MWIVRLALQRPYTFVVMAMLIVRLGRDLGNRFVVVSGIRGDERLVVNPGDGLIDGQQIAVGRREEMVQK